MIKELNIKNFALIKELQLDFIKGFNVFIGETGAGKSIILKALKFILGDKANKNYIRSGENTMSVRAVFENYSKQTSCLLKNFGYENEDVIVINRNLNLEGKSECRLNGKIISLTMLKELCETLVNSCGQHESLQLLKPSNYLNLLDNFNPQKTILLKEQIQDLLKSYKFIDNQISILGGDENQRNYKIELLNYQINEIESVNFKPDEDRIIQEKLEIMKNSEKISKSLKNVVDNLEQSYNDSVLQKLNLSIKNLEQIVMYYPELDNYINRLNSCYLEIQDISNSLNNELYNISFNENEFEVLDNRLDTLKSLKKKYSSSSTSSLEDVEKYLQNIKKELDDLLNADKKIESLSKELKIIEQNLLNKCFELSAIRHKIAQDLETKLENELSQLGMQNCCFKINFSLSSNNTTLTGKDCHNNGIDIVEFLFSANKGQALKPLSQTISGGELSRFMLALQNLVALNDEVNTLVFFFFYSGISGEIGSAIAERIAKLSKNFQVICITHLPQVAVMADKYFYISKKTLQEQTFTFAETLSDSQVYKHIAKLSGGNYQSSASIEHAKELKTWAENFKNQ